jgi:death-on-curing protein
VDDPIWIEIALAKAIHARQLAEHGGADGVRDEGLLTSALGRARHLFAYSDPTPDVQTLAAAYAYGIAKNHAFIDGNKRAALVISLTFLALNGHTLSATREEVYNMFLGLAAGDVSEDEMGAWLTAHSARIA